MRVAGAPALALVVAATALIGCGGGGHHHASEPTELRQAHAPDGNRAAEERRDDARDQKKEANTRWDKLGERTVEGKLDKDAIGVGRDDGRFSEIQLKVEGSALEMYDVLVTFGDGTTFSPPTRLTFGKGTTSRVIDLPGGKRAIKRVDFKYGNLPGGGRAQVELWAR